MIDLEIAVNHIRQACDESQEHGRPPFFFLVGAGISCPPIPLASAIVEHCKSTAKQYNRLVEPTGKQPIDIYSHWFHQAYPQPIQRQRYLRQLIEGKAISHANFRLAHLLLEKTITNLVVTTNFDDFLSRALVLFGKPHIVCDHPNTVERIDPERDDVQIIHVHGTYWFYDCCNLRSEIELRSQSSVQTTSTMSSLLERILSRQTPLVIGYGGWEGDVIMNALRRRLQGSLPYNLYWFCHRHTEVDSLPIWLRSHEQVYFVVPPTSDRAGQSLDEMMESGGYENKGAEQKLAEDTKGSEAKERGQSRLSAQQVLDKLIQVFGLKAPDLTTDPLGFFAGKLHNSLLQENVGAETDIYFISSVVKRIERAKQREIETIHNVELTLEKVRDAMRRSQYQEAVNMARRIDGKDLTTTQLRELLDAMWSAAARLSDDPVKELLSYELVLKIGDMLLKQNIEDTALRERVAKALLNKGYWFSILKRWDGAISICDEVVKRFSEFGELALCESVARALYNKGISLEALGRSEEELACYDEVVKRFGDRADSILREAVARALARKGYRLTELNQNEEAISVYDEVVGRFGEAVELPLREWVVRALYNKGISLNNLDRSAEAISTYDELIKRFCGAAEPVLRERVAKAAIKKAVTLGNLDRKEEEIAIYDEMVTRFGQSKDSSLRESVAEALVNKAITLGTLDRIEDELAVYDEVVKRFGEAIEPALRESVARALVNKGYRLNLLKGSEDAISVYDEVARRFGKAIEPVLYEAVITALLNKGILLLQQGSVSQAHESFSKLVESSGNKQRINIQLNKVVALAGLNQYGEASLLLQQIVGKTKIDPQKAKVFLSNLESLVSAPEPPNGIRHFLEEARDLLEKTASH